MDDYNEIDIFFKQFSEIKDIFSEEFIDKSHIYALFDSNKNLIYIGKSDNAVIRFNEHKKNIADATLCRYVQVPKDKVCDIEFVLISKFLPRENKSLPPRNSYYTLDEYQKFDQKFYLHRVCVLRLLNSHNIDNINGYYHKNDLDFISSKLNDRVK